LHSITDVEHHRQVRSERKRGELRDVCGSESVFDNIKCIRFAFEKIENRCDICRSPYLVWRDFKAKRASRSLNFSVRQHSRRIALIKNNC
jgi:hypothetical protein